MMKYLRPWLAAFALSLAIVSDAAAEAPTAIDASQPAPAAKGGASEISQAQDSCGPTTPYRRRWGSRHRRRHHRRHHRHDRGGWGDWGGNAKIPGLN